MENGHQNRVRGQQNYFYPVWEAWGKGKLGKNLTILTKFVEFFVH